jgi:hypothetical protein
MESADRLIFLAQMFRVLRLDLVVSSGDLVGLATTSLVSGLSLPLCWPHEDPAANLQ